MKFKEWFTKNHIDAYKNYCKQYGENVAKRSSIVIPYVVCNDGFSMSVQASYGHYCAPKFTFDLSGLSNFPYYEFEIGYPSEDFPLLTKESDISIYSYVPLEIVENIIDTHGGIVEQSEAE